MWWPSTSECKKDSRSEIFIPEMYNPPRNTTSFMKILRERTDMIMTGKRETEFSLITMWTAFFLPDLLLQIYYRHYHQHRWFSFQSFTSLDFWNVKEIVESYSNITLLITELQSSFQTQTNISPQNILKYFFKLTKMGL